MPGDESALRMQISTAILGAERLTIYIVMVVVQGPPVVLSVIV